MKLLHQPIGLSKPCIRSCNPRIAVAFNLCPNQSAQMGGFLQLIVILFVITKHNYSIHDAPTAIRTIAVYRSAI